MKDNIRYLINRAKKDGWTYVRKSGDYIVGQMPKKYQKLHCNGHRTDIIYSYCGHL